MKSQFRTAKSKIYNKSKLLGEHVYSKSKAVKTQLYRRSKYILGTLVILLVITGSTLSVLTQTHDLFGLRINPDISNSLYSRTSIILDGLEMSTEDAQGIIGLSWPSGGHKCGGVLVSPRWVLTAAHCEIDEGTSVRYINSDGGDSFRTVDRFQPYQGYNSVTLENDIALVRLNETIDDVSPIKLNSRDKNIMQRNMDVIAAGWGQTEPGERKRPSDDLLFIKLILYGDNAGTCSNHAATPPLYYKTGGIDLTLQNICASDVGSYKGVCNGDSGGPLFADNNGENVVLGVGSWVLRPCGRPYTPDMFTRVDSYDEWIRYYAPDATFVGDVNAVTIEDPAPTVVEPNNIEPLDYKNLKMIVVLGATMLVTIAVITAAIKTFNLRKNLNNK